MIVLTAAGVVLVLQALCFLTVACDADGTSTSSERAWSALLVGCTLLGAFALFGWVD